MKLAVFGATGPTGKLFIQQALNNGHVITAFARSWSVAPMERLKLVVGDATRDKAKVIQAVTGQDAVISMLGRRSTLRAEGLMERSMQLIVPAMERAGVARLVMMSAFGVGESSRDAPLVPRMMYRTLLRDIFHDKAIAEAQVRASQLDWTIVHPVLLTDGPATGRYRAGEKLPLQGMPKISRADVARFILGEVEAPAYSRKTVVLSY